MKRRRRQVKKEERKMEEENTKERKKGKRRKTRSRNPKPGLSLVQNGFLGRAAAESVYVNFPCCVWSSLSVTRMSS